MGWLRDGSLPRLCMLREAQCHPNVVLAKARTHNPEWSWCDELGQQRSLTQLSLVVMGPGFRQDDSGVAASPVSYSRPVQHQLRIREIGEPRRFWALEIFPSASLGVDA